MPNMEERWEGGPTQRDSKGAWSAVFVLKPWFHWQYSGVAIPALWATAIAMVGLGIAFDAQDEIGTFFLLAYLFLVGTWLYARGFFVTSDTVQNLAHDQRSPADGSRLRHGLKLFIYVAIPIVLMTLILITFLLFTHRIERLHRLNTFSGVLIPADDPIELVCGRPIEGDEAIFLFGDTAVKFRNWPITILRIGHKRMITMDTSQDGSVTISADIYSSDGKIITEIAKNAFDINRNNIFTKERPDDSTLSVTDQYGQRVLYIRYKNRHEMHFDAKLWYPEIGSFSPNNVVTNLCVDARDSIGALFGFGPQ
jgi:hypothetical protein